MTTWRTLHTDMKDFEEWLNGAESSLADLQSERHNRAERKEKLKDLESQVTARHKYEKRGEKGTNDNNKNKNNINNPSKEKELTWCGRRGCFLSSDGCIFHGLPVFTIFAGL